MFAPVVDEQSTLIDCVSVGLDRMKRKFELMRKQVDGYEDKRSNPDVTVKVVIYEAFPVSKLSSHGLREVIIAATSVLGSNAFPRQPVGTHRSRPRYAMWCCYQEF